MWKQTDPPFLWRTLLHRLSCLLACETVSLLSKEPRCTGCDLLGSSHSMRRSVVFQAARRRWYKILLLRPGCGVCGTRQLARIFVAAGQKHATPGIVLTLIFTPDAWYRPIRARARGSTPASNRNNKNGRSERGRYFLAHPTPNHSSFASLFLFHSAILLRWPYAVDRTSKSKN